MWVWIGLMACGDDTTSTTPSDGQVFAYTPETFPDAYKETYCEQFETCNTAATCQAEDISAGFDTGCTFDVAKADACIDGQWTCDASGGPGLEVIVPPVACQETFVCS